MDKPIVSAAPHIHSGASGKRIMLDVIIALIPACLAGVFIFGVRALAVILCCLVSALLWELLIKLMLGEKQSLGDLSAAVTGLLLGLNLNAAVPLWQCVLGAGFAIVIVKCLFGGLGHNFANPAAAGRVFMLLAFPAVAGGVMPRFAQLQSSATPLELLSGAGQGLPSLAQMFLGLRGGAVGESCIAALLLGFVYLLWRRVIKWYVPAVFVATVFVCYFLVTGDAVFALYEIMAGGLFLGAIFMATDYVTSPITNLGKLVFAFGCGIFSFIIRYFCAYPEGVSFAILIMNILTPYIETFTAKKALGGGIK